MRALLLMLFWCLGEFDAITCLDGRVVVHDARMHPDMVKLLLGEALIIGFTMVLQWFCHGFTDDEYWKCFAYTSTLQQGVCWFFSSSALPQSICWRV